MKAFSTLLFLSLLVSGCATKGKTPEFVKTVTFSSLQSFSYQDTIINGLDFRESEKSVLEEISRAALTSEFRERGFSERTDDGDFFVVTKWRKHVSSTPDLFDHIDGPTSALNQREKITHRFASRMTLIVEVYEKSTGNLFWRKELPNVFDSVQFTEERIVASLERAVKNFPPRVEKDPNLPDIE